VSEATAHLSGTFELGGELEVRRLGFGAMRLTGPGVWGPPQDSQECLRVLWRAVELGVNFIDTADCYGPHVSEELIRAALHPYPDDLVIATKAGLVRGGPIGPNGSGASSVAPLGFPAYLRQQCVLSLRRLDVDCIGLFQLHRIDPKFPLEDQIGELAALQQEGKIRHIGLSEVDVDQLQAARRIAPIASVQNHYNLFARSADRLLSVCEKDRIAFIPWAPMTGRPQAVTDDLVQRTAQRHRATPAQLALAWLLHRSPAMLPIPGTSNVAHLEENVAAAAITLGADDISALGEIAA
jgi:aryl-alcohol dehydrogenase-like predicted oxidoreductase